MRPRIHHKWRPCETPRAFRAYSVHLSAAPCTAGKTHWSPADLAVSRLSNFPSPPIMEEKPGLRPQLAGTTALHSYQPMPSAHARHMAHSTVACWSGPSGPVPLLLRSRPPKPSRLPSTLLYTRLDYTHFALSLSSVPECLCLP
jgi:hypothetical protein